MNKAILSILLLFSLLLIGSSQAYPFRSVFQDDGSVNNIVTPPSFYSIAGQNCTGTFSIYATASNGGSPYTLGNSWYSPDSTFITSTNPPYSLSQTCGLQGSYAIGNKNSTSNFYETRTTTTTTASVTHTYQVANYNCNPKINTGTLSDVIIYTNTTLNDSFGHRPYHYLIRTWQNCAGGGEPSLSIQQSTLLNSLQEYSDGCPTSGATTLGWDYDVTPNGSYLCGAFTSGGESVWIIVPFNGQYAGKVNISLNSLSIETIGAGGISCTKAKYIYLYDRSNGQWQNLGTGVPFSTNLNLPVTSSPREYYLAIGSVCISTGAFGFSTGANWHNIDYNLSISAYQPSISCGTYSNCTGGTRQRNCQDLNHILPNWTDYDQTGCAPVFPTQSIFIGFDSGHIQKSFYCGIGITGGIFFPCTRDPVTQDRGVPNGWIRGGYFGTDNVSAGGTGLSGWIQDYVDIDQSDYYGPDASPSEGALKIWFLPKKTFLPVYNFSTGGVTCQTTTEGQVGQSLYDINNTFWVSNNITTLSPYMTFSYRAKKCTGSPSATPIQSGANLLCTIGCQILNDCSSHGLCDNLTAPSGSSANFYGDDYYTGTNCPADPPPSHLAVRIRDITANSTNVQYYGKEITAPNWELGYQEDNINNMSINHTYEISFSAYPQTSITQTETNCILIDDVNVNFRSQAIPCTSGCASELLGLTDYNGDGLPDYTYIESSTLSSSSCTIKVLPLDSRCTPANITTNIEQTKSGQINYTCDGTTMITWNRNTATPTFTPNSPTCVAQRGTGNPLNAQTGDVIVTSFASIFAIPAVIAILMSLLVSGLITAKVSKVTGGNVGGEGHGGGVIFIITFIGLLTAFTAANMFPLWLYIVLVVIAGGIAAKVIGFI
jgi:hypothetical protein